MSAWDLDADTNNKILNEADHNLDDPSKPEQPSVFAGFGKATGKGIFKGGARTAQTLAILEAAPVVVYDEIMGTNYQKDWFENQVEPLSEAVDYWTVDAETTGKAGQIVGGLGEMAIPLMLTGGNPTALIANQQVGIATDLVRQDGVDPTTANLVGGVNAVATAAGFKVPASVGTQAITKAGTGAGINVGFGAVADAASSQTLKANNYNEVAERFSPANVENRAIDAGMGVVFGLLNTPRPKPLNRAEVDAVLTTRNSEHFINDTAVGIFADAQAEASHQSALSTAFSQMAKGEPVNVEVAGTFKPRPSIDQKQKALNAFRDAAIDTAPDLAAKSIAIRQNIDPSVLKRGAAKDIVNYAEKVGFAPELALAISSIETGGRFNANAKSPHSTAHGLFQVLDGTWRQNGGGNRNSVQEQLRVGFKIMRDTQNYLSKRLGRDIAAHELYLGHLLGPKGAEHVLKADPNRPLIDVVREYDSKRANKIVNNNGMKGLTAGQAVKKWASKVREHAKKAGVDIGPVYRDMPSNRNLWEADIQPHLRQQKGVDIGHVEEIAQTWRATESGDMSPKTINFDFMDEPAAQKINQITGLDFNDYQHLITKDDLASIRDQSLSVAPESNQLQLTQVDIERVPEVIRSYDNVERITKLDDGGAPLEPEKIRYSKQYDDGSVIHVEESVNPDKTLSTKAVYKEQNNQGRIAQELNDSKNSTVDAAQPVISNQLDGNEQARLLSSQDSIRNETGKVRQDSTGTRATEQTTAEALQVDMLRDAASTMPDAQVSLQLDENGNPVKMTLAEALETIEHDRAREIQDAKMYMSAAMCTLLRGV